MKTHGALLRNVFFTFIIFLSACVSTLEIDPVSDFPASEEKIHKSVFLNVAPETREYILTGDAGAATVKIPIGTVLLQSATNSLQAVFQEVVHTETRVAENAANPTLSLAFSEDTWLKPGGTTVSNSKVNISLRAILIDSSGTEIWNKIVSAEVSRGSRVGLVSNFFGGIGGAIGNASYEGAMETACEEALGQALLALNKELANHKSIFEGQ